MMKTTNEKKEYLHFPLNEPVDLGTTSYWIASEDRLPFGGREVLCIVRDTDCITSCCGGESKGFRSIGVLGYIEEWHSKTANGLPVSVVEPIIDETERRELTRILQRKYRVPQIEFL